MTVNYSIIQSDEGAIAVQSTVQSFNLDHITNKDIVSFYTRFSQFSAWDTGILPVDGSGILSIRTAGEYTQFAYQHKPGLYHVNWGKSEGAAAAAYYLAQPYRIIICDMKDGNLLGARMFYSPYPITNPSQPLYHVNLPNINCNGYRGNGVGWICLYQNEDWSALPLNERIVRFIERCSGVETYNDANMSETDGTRFYKKNDKPSYFWDPVEWEAKSAEEGYQWTLDEDLLIPVLVKSMDSQSEHCSNGVPLTFADALVGDYQAYYYDKKHTKTINAVIRPDKELDPKEILSFFVASYNGANSQSNPLLNNTFESSELVKQNVGSATFTGSVLTNAPAAHASHEDSPDVYCETCEGYFTQDDISGDYYGNNVCTGCIEEHFTYIESADAYFNHEDENILYIDLQATSFHTEFDSVEICENCDQAYGKEGKNNSPGKVICLDNNDNVCPKCIEDYAHDKGLSTGTCISCAKFVVTESDFSHHYLSTHISLPYYDYETNQSSSDVKVVTFCSSCQDKVLVCPCGLVKSKDAEGFNPCTPIQSDGTDSIIVSKACSSCVEFTFQDQGDLEANFVPVSISNFVTYQNQLNSITSIHQGFQKTVDEEPF
jgi:hypothetical protein